MPDKKNSAPKKVGNVLSVANTIANNSSPKQPCLQVLAAAVRIAKKWHDHLNKSSGGAMVRSQPIFFRGTGFKHKATDFKSSMPSKLQVNGSLFSQMIENQMSTQLFLARMQSITLQNLINEMPDLAEIRIAMALAGSKCIVLSQAGRLDYVRG